MKKVFTIILLICILPISAFCQYFTLWGLFFGCGSSTIFGGDSWKDPVGVQFGVESPIYEINDNSMILSGLNFTWQGAGYEETYNEPGYGGSTLSGRVRLGYLNVPLLFHFILKEKIYGEIGLQPGFLLAAKDKYDGESYDYKAHMNKFELGLPVGAGYRLNDMFDVGVRFTYGITSIDKGGGSDHNFLAVAYLRYKLQMSK